jgi:alkylation response protein AidB-like acyl-CoA dehydrogenase
VNFDLSETQELFQSAAERFARTVDVAGREKIRAMPGGYNLARWTELAELGLLAIVASDKHGGLDGSLNDLSVIAESLGAHNSVDPWLENGALPIRLLDQANNTDVLATLLDGSKIAALAFSEPTSRYDLFPHGMHATPTASSTYSLSGEKLFVMGGAIADTLLVTANENGTFRVFTVPSNSNGLIVRNYRLADGSQASEISFDRVEVPASALLELSFEQFLKVIAHISVLCCSEILGLSQLLLNDTIAYVKEREQFDVSIGSFQVIQHGLVDCYSELEQMRSLLYRTLLLETDSDDEWRANVMGAKSFISEGANQIARTAVQYHGAMGVTDEVSIGHAMKRIIILARLFGDASENLKQYVDVA